MRIPAGLYEGFYMSVVEPPGGPKWSPSPVAKAKAARPMVRLGPGHLPLLYRDPGTRAWVPRPVRPPRDRVDVSEMRLALAVPLRSVRQRPKLSRDGLLLAKQESVLPRLCAGVSGGPRTVLGLGVLLPDALPLAPGVACLPGPA